MRLVWGLAAAFIIMVAGFWPSFFANPLQNDVLHLVHGILASGWMIILITQAWLITRGQSKLHHMIGRLSIVWAIALVATAIGILLYSLRATGPHSLPVPWRPILAFIDIPSLILFSGFYAAAIFFAFRRQIDLHYRAMICSVIVIFSPALGRLLPRIIPGIDGLIPALHPCMWLCEAACIGLIIYDYLIYKKTFAPYWVALGGSVLIDIFMLHAPEMMWFMTMIRSWGFVG